MRIIQSNPPELTKLLFDLGPRTLVLVEGKTDQRVLDEWFAGQRGYVMFAPSGSGRAVNWVLSEATSQTKFLSEGYDLSKHSDMKQHMIGQLACDLPEAERRLAEKVALLNSCFVSIDRAHRFFNGKHILHHAYDCYVVNVKRGWDKEHFVGLLARTVGRRGVPLDIQAIIQDRILKATSFP